LRGSEIFGKRNTRDLKGVKAKIDTKNNQTMLCAIAKIAPYLETLASSFSKIANFRTFCGYKNLHHFDCSSRAEKTKTSPY